MEQPQCFGIKGGHHQFSRFGAVGIDFVSYQFGKSLERHIDVVGLHLNIKTKVRSRGDQIAETRNRQVQIRVGRGTDPGPGGRRWIMVDRQLAIAGWTDVEFDPGGTTLGRCCKTSERVFRRDRGSAAMATHDWTWGLLRSLCHLAETPAGRASHTTSAEILREIRGNWAL